MKPGYQKAYQRLGRRYRRLRVKVGMVQEDVIEHGFAVRHYQQLEAGRPHSLTTLFRVAEMFGEAPSALLAGLGRPAKGRRRGKPKA